MRIFVVVYKTKSLRAGWENGVFLCSSIRLYFVSGLCWQAVQTRLSECIGNTDYSSNVVLWSEFLTLISNKSGDWKLTITPVRVVKWLHGWSHTVTSSSEMLIIIQAIRVAHLILIWILVYSWLGSKVSSQYLPPWCVSDQTYVFCL